ncbi:hypothetical protein [Siccibacter turicensis]|uniref:hypothetical protein n=1 Tax=Siccibacter turicensis TaxID=357233 RepID=UPI003F5619CB
MRQETKTRSVREQQLRNIYPELTAWDGDCVLAAWSVYRGLTRKSDDLPAARDEGFLSFLTDHMQATIQDMSKWS